ncbi:HAD-IIIC family phosphatase [Paenibacillus kobensis]|uniref:HAD-IIIC family phosphatase n=1 Tax=Paenibacillus kobensis TaxID=59841 RepID=UPI000FD8A02A|nr:HAD-IIIC family phosphatase [Paenibacillus kobensis]
MTNESVGTKVRQKVKCVVWDLDNTVWEGVLLEDVNVSLREGIVDIIKALDSRGILQSIASKNEHKSAMDKLEAFGLAEYFIYPQINWNSKSSSLSAIAGSINIGIDTLAFVDDQPFEREEVNFVHPDVLCLDVTELPGLLDMPEMNPRFITEDSKNRRQMYMSDITRNNLEEQFVGTQEEFLASLNMKFTIAKVGEGDLQRAEELTVRTHQLNTTGYTYSYEELDALRQSDSHLLLVSELEDKYGSYGKIGLTLVEMNDNVWTIKLLLMSCRVMSRGVGSVMINHLMHLAKEAGATLRAEFVSTDKNRMMYVTYKFAGFKEIQEEGDYVLFENDLSSLQPLSPHVTLVVEP